LRRSLALAASASALLVATACGGDNGAATTAGGTPTTAGGGVGATTVPQAADEGVSEAVTDLGTILVDPEGFTIYAFTQDTGGTSTCYDDCEALWPPVPADTPISSDLAAAQFGSTTRTDGSEQLTIGGQPLYRYTPDANPGDILGQGFGGVWFVVGRDGTLVQVSAPTPTSRYDY
jgi:predicted lipoprotein with Yx(FWY)xxD motif